MIMIQDPFILLSTINMKLRDSGEDLDSLCKSEGYDRAELERRLGKAGFEYLPAANQFR